MFPGLSTAHSTYSETELRLYSQPLQRVTAEYTHLTDRQVDYPVFLSLPLTLSDLALATGEIPTEWFDRSLCNLWTDLRSALLYSTLQLWKGQENFQNLLIFSCIFVFFIFLGPEIFFLYFFVWLSYLRISFASTMTDLGYPLQP